MDIDLEQARRRAKELLRAARRGETRLRDDREPLLADAQRAVARDLGFPSWPALVAHVEASQGDRQERRRRLMAAALGGRDDLAERLLAHDPALANAGLDVALVLGDAPAVAAALDADPELVGSDLPDVGRKPLSCACHSVFLRPSSPRAPGVRRTIELLLDRGADPNEVHHNEFGAMSVLYGAAGVAHDLEATRVLLDRGANPDDGESVYHAAEADDTACLELLLASGARVRDTNALGNAMADPVKVRVLLEQGDLRPDDPELRNALLYARDPAVAELLIEHGAALDARDGDGLTPYSRAARFRDDAMMRLLERAGGETELDPAAEWIGAVVRGEPHAPEPPAPLGHGDAEELPRWASTGEDEIVTRLLDAGVPLDARGVDDGTALHYAGMWGRPSTVALLLDRGAEVNDVGGPREAPSTPLGWTAWGSRMLPGATERLEGYREATRLLVAAGARVEPGMIEVAADDVAVVLEEASPLSAARVQWGEGGEIELDTGLEYARGVPVRVHVRKRAPRYELDDMGGALASAGEPEGWMPVGERVVADQGLNVNRPGRVFVQVAEGRDLDRIARQVAETSLAVYAALLEL
jgi:ankyrin repeat protein